MLWRGIELSTFDVPTLEGWIDNLYDEIKVICAEIDRRTEEAAGPPVVVDKRTGRPFQRVGSSDRPTDPGHPPAETKREGKESL